MLPRHHPQRTRLDAILCAFDDAVRGGSEPHIDVWLADWPDLQTRCTAVAELLCVGCELRDFDYAWLADQFRRWSGDLESRELRIGLLRALAHDQVETGRQLEWAHFRPFRFSPEELDLRDDGDLFSLGSVVASRFSLDARIGSGAFGVVYRATELATGRSVALKAPRGRDPDAQQHAAQRLVAEGALLARFACAQVLRLFETATTEAGTPLLVMELITGGTLADMLRRGPLPLDEALSLTEQIAMGLDGSHRLGLVHRDLKPANVLIDSRGRPVLADFGIALDENAAAEQEGMIVGTLGRMSVESLLGIVTEVDGRADVWALGGLLYEMITGEPLISAESREASLVGSVLAGTRRLVFPSHVPENVQRLIECAVSRDQKLRFDRAADVAEICRTLRTEPHAQPTMPVVRPPLVAWRLGLTMAVVCERLQAFRAGISPRHREPEYAGHHAGPGPWRRDRL
jgi:hypothetical protein